MDYKESRKHMKHIFVMNPVSGVRNQIEEIKKEVSKYLTSDETVFYETKGHGDAIIFVSEFITAHPNQHLRFYACGGDGTLNEVVNGAIIGGDLIEVANLPIGSANDFLKYFSDRNFKNYQNIINGEVVKVDLLKINDRYGLNVFNVGFDAKVVVYQRKLKKLPLVSGKMAYKLGVVASLFGKMAHKMCVTIDDEVVYDGKTTMVAVANAICYGGGFYCTPIAKVNDGLLDACVVKKVSLPTFAKLINIYKRGEHLESEKTKDYIIYKQGQKITIEIDKPIFYAIDGELGKSNIITLEIIPCALNFVIAK